MDNQDTSALEKAMSDGMPHRAYYVSCPTDETVLLAMQVVLNGNLVEWHDTQRRRGMQMAEILRGPDVHGFAFRRHGAGNGVYTFQPLTLDLYNRFVRDRLADPRTFADEATLFHALEASLHESS